MTVSTVGVIGAGQMGNGIAHVMSLAGYEVYMNDVNPAALEASLGLIEKNMIRQLMLPQSFWLWERISWLKE